MIYPRSLAFGFFFFIIINAIFRTDFGESQNTLQTRSLNFIEINKKKATNKKQGHSSIP